MKPQYPLVFSSLLIRMGVGIMVTHIVMSFAYNPIVADGLVAVFSMALVGLGIVISMLHLGRPNRLLHAFYNLSSPLTWEAILTPLLLASMFAIAVSSYLGGIEWLGITGKIGTVLFGILIIYNIAKVYHLKARPSWSTPLVVYEFFLSAVCMGILGYVGIVPFFGKAMNAGLLFLSGLALIALLAEFGITIYYRHFVKNISQTASEALQEKTALVQYGLWMGLGLGIPFILCALTLLTKQVHSGIVSASFISFFLGAMFWRILFFKAATPIKITPDIDM
jgi:DMSO reductase anchor subunit